MKHWSRWHPDAQHWGKAGEYHSCSLCHCVGIYPTMCGISSATSFHKRLLGWRKGPSAPLCRVWVFYSVAGPGFWPDYASTIASVWCPSLCLPLLWLRCSQTIPRPGSSFGKLLEQSPPISLQSQTISITHKVPITQVPHQTTWILSPWALPFLPVTEACP